MKRFFSLVLLFFSFSFFLNVNGIKNNAENTEVTIPIAMTPDDNYVYPTIVAMTSILENKNDSTHIDFNILIPDDVSDENKDRLRLLGEMYKNSSVKLIEMKDKFKDSYCCGYPVSTYYRLLLASLLPQYDKVLYLDGDILVRHDLKNMYSLNLGNDYIAGVKDYPGVCCRPNDYAKRLGVESLNQYINAGILIMNLKKIREDKIEDKFKNFIPELKNRGLWLNDQDVLNAVCYNRIKHINLGYNYMQFVTYNYKKETGLLNCYSAKEMDEAYDDSTIVHFASSNKPWKNKNIRFYDEWDKYRKIAEEKIYGTPSLANGTYIIESALNKDKVLDIDGAKTNSKANLQLWGKNYTNAQKFYVEYIGEGYYTIKALCSGKYLDVEGAKKDCGTNVWQYDWNGSNAQKWLIKKAGNGYYHVISKCNGLYLDVSGAKTKNGTNIHVWGFNGTNAQKFKFLSSN